MENVIYLELWRRCPEDYEGQLSGGHEVDFSRSKMEIRHIIRWSRTHWMRFFGEMNYDGIQKIY